MRSRATAALGIRHLLRGVLAVLMVGALVGLLPAPAFAAVSVTRADLSGTNLRLEGTAIANRDITVDGVVMGRSDGSGRFRIDRTGYTAPADCTVYVNDGSATPRAATLSGCTVTSPPQPGPVAPTPLSPVAGANVTTPLTLSWAAVLDPASINGGYNWQVSTTTSFATLVTRNSTTPSVTQASVGGLVPGTYFWQVQAVDSSLRISTWSSPRSFVVTGSGPGALAAPVLQPLPFGTTYHPWEHFPFSWSPVAGASSYVVEASRDPLFPAPVEVSFNNISQPDYGLTMGDSLIGSWNLRVYAVDANGVPSPVSNVRTFSISYTAPVGPAPTLVSRASGASLELPILLDWNDVANPQPSGYEAQVASDPGFSNVEVQVSGQTSSQYPLLGLSPGTKYWRVRHAQGDASPTTAAVTAWSEVWTFTVSSAAPRIASISLLGAPAAFSGTTQVGELQLTGPAPAGGAAVDLTSTAPGATPVPARVTIPAGQSFAQFQITTGQVTVPTASTVTATFGTSSASASITVEPPSLKQIVLFSPSISGGAPASAFVTLNGTAPAGGAAVNLTSDSPLAVPPTTVTVPAGAVQQAFTIETQPVSADTPVQISATWKGLQLTQQLTIIPAVAPFEWTVDPTVTTGSQGSFARVAIAQIQSKDVTFTLSSSNPGVAQLPPTVTIPAGSPHAGVLVGTTNPAVSTDVTLSVTGGGVTKTAVLTVSPIPPAPLPAPTLMSPAVDARFAPGQSVTFDWSDVTGAESYVMQVSTSSTFGTILVERPAAASQTSTAFLATGTRYWRVRALRSDGSTGAWSAVRSFRVK